MFLATGDPTRLSNWSIARLDSGDSCGSVGSAKQLEVDPTSGQQVVNAAFEVTRGEVGIEVRTRARSRG